MTDPTPAFRDAVAFAISAFGQSLEARYSAHELGEPEDQLRGPTELLFDTVAHAFGRSVVLTGENAQRHLGLRLDYAVTVAGALTGHIELKAPGKGADTSAYRGHDKEQWEKAQALPNVLYSDGNSWGLYRSGALASPLQVLDGDVRWTGRPLSPRDAGLARLLVDFLSWEPIPPSSTLALAKQAALLCRLLRDDVMRVMEAEGLQEAQTRAFTSLANEWRTLLFPGASDESFADSYAQTVTFAMLLARFEEIPLDNLTEVAITLGHDHSLIARALAVLTDDRTRALIPESISLMQRVLGVVHWDLLDHGHPPLPGLSQHIGHRDNPWHYFYDDFLSVYDPELREKAGAYYTPYDLVHAQVAIVSDLLTHRMNKPLGFASDGVVTLDPAMGTGSYLAEVVSQAAAAVTVAEGIGSVPPRIAALAQSLVGFEIMTGPYAVAELQLAAVTRQAVGHERSCRLYLTDTLSDPYIEESHLGGLYEPIARSRRLANEVKLDTPVMVCLGNPPYDRHAADESLGGWVRYGHQGSSGPIMSDFIAPDLEPAHIASLYNLYVYFWRWALWKVFEADTACGPGIVAFVTSSSFLEGPGFAKMREHMRRLADEIYVLDLGGEGLGAQREQNVFPITLPVAITICARYGSPHPDSPAMVRYHKVSGSRADKLATLSTVSALSLLEWSDVPSDWRAGFRPAAPGDWLAMPSIFDLIPWRLPGIMANRTWPVAPSDSILKRRWTRLVQEADVAVKRQLLKEEVHRRLESNPHPIPGFPALAPLIQTAPTAPMPQTASIGWRSFDTQRMIADTRVVTLARPELWRSLSPRQVFLVTLNAAAIGRGPAVTASADVPDKHYFRGSFGGAVLPLWNDADCTNPNIAQGLLNLLSSTYSLAVSPEDLFAYVSAVCAHDAYSDSFSDNLRTGGPRVPLTADKALFSEAVTIGRQVLWLQTLGERFAAPERPPLSGAAMVRTPISTETSDCPQSASWEDEAITIGTGTVAPVPRAIWDYQVSGMPVLQKWIARRTARPPGRRFSPLDSIVADHWSPQWTTQLLHLIWSLERLTALTAEQDLLLARIMASPLLDREALVRSGVDLGRQRTASHAATRSYGAGQLALE